MSDRRRWKVDTDREDGPMLWHADTGTGLSGSDFIAWAAGQASESQRMLSADQWDELIDAFLDLVAQLKDPS